MSRIGIVEDPIDTSNAPIILVDEAMGVRPTPAQILSPHDEVEPPNERTGLLAASTTTTHSTSRASSRASSRRRRRELRWYQKPHAMWVIPYVGLWAVVYGAGLSATIEILTQVICRQVEPISLPQPPVTAFPLPMNPSRPNSIDREDAAAARMVEFQAFTSTLNATPSGMPPILRPRPDRYILGFRIARPVDESWAAQCRKSDDVSLATTAFMTTLSMATGVLSIIVKGIYGKSSDRYGRVPLLSLSAVTNLIDTISIVLVATFTEVFGTKALFASQVLTTLMGGPTNGMTMVSAYLADLAAVSGESRTKALSYSQAIIFAGMAFGPLVGSLLVRMTGLLLAPLYVAVVYHILTFLMFLFIAPESLPESNQHEQRRKMKEERIEAAARRKQELQEWQSKNRNIVLMRTIRLVKKPLQLFEPLRVLLPKVYDQTISELDRPLLNKIGAPGEKDWRLTQLGLSWTLLVISAGVGTVKILYARAAFDWGPVEIGEWITFTSVVRIFTLLLAVPLLVKLFRKPAPSPSVPRPIAITSDPLASEFDLNPKLVAAQTEWETEAAKLKLVNDLKFDRKLALISIILGVFGFLIMSFPRKDSLLFIVGSAFIGFSSPASPALQGLALALAPPSQAGQVLASLDVLLSIATDLIGVAGFGSLYILVLGWYREAVFIAAACAVLSSAIILATMKMGFRNISS